MKGPELDPPDPETVMDGSGVTLRDFEAYMDETEAAVDADRDPGPFADHEPHAADADLGLGPAYYDIEPEMNPEVFRELWADMEAEAGQ